MRGRAFVVAVGAITLALAVVARADGVVSASPPDVEAFGDARFFGATNSVSFNRPIVGIAGTRSSRGYWETATDGGVFAFGDARFHGSMGGTHLNEPVVGIAASPTGRG